MSEGVRQGPPRWAIAIALIVFAAIAALYIFTGEPVVEAPVYDGPYEEAPILDESPPAEDAAPASEETENPADDATAE